MIFQMHYDLLKDLDKFVDQLQISDIFNKKLKISEFEILEIGRNLIYAADFQNFETTELLPKVICKRIIVTETEGSMLEEFIPIDILIEYLEEYDEL